jgi:hypothetical protein
MCYLWWNPAQTKRKEEERQDPNSKQNHIQEKGMYVKQDRVTVYTQAVGI